MKRFWVEILSLNALLWRAQKEESSTTEKVSCFREDISRQEQNVARKMKSKGASGDVLDEKEKHVIGPRKKGDFFLKWQGPWLNYIPLLERE